MEDSEWQDERRSLALPGEHPHAVGPLPFLIPFGWGVNLGIGCEILGRTCPCVDLLHLVHVGRAWLNC
jgi:hypothetical protein